MYRLTCQCGAAFEVDERAVGKHFKCVGCHRRIWVDQVNLQKIKVYRFVCECGAAFRVKQKAIGGTFRCPRCQTVTRIDREHLAVIDDERVSKSSRTSLPVEFPDKASVSP
jgi:hypothetical protein